MHLRSVSLALVLLFLASGARAQSFDTIVFDGVVAVRGGDIAPGTGGGTFVSFSSLSLSPSGAIAFVGSATGGTVSHGLFLHDGGVTIALVLAGDTAPDTGGVFSVFHGVDVNDAGDIAFEALATGSFWAAGSGEGVFRQSGAVVEKVVLGEELAPLDTGGASYARLGLGEVALGEGGHVGFRSDLTGGTTANGIFRETPGVSPVVSSVALQGQVAPGTGGGTYTVLDRLAVDGAGAVAFSASYGGASLSNGIFRDSSGTDSSVSLQGHVAPGTGGFYGSTSCASVTQAALGSDVELNDAGQVAFRGSAGGGPTGLFTDTAGTDAVVVLQGTVTPGGGGFGCFQSGTHLSLNELGDVAFWSTITASSAEEGVFVRSGGTVSAVALQDQSVPGGGAVYFAFSSSSVQVDDTGRIAFGVTTSSPGEPDDDADGIPNVLDKCSLDSRNSVAPATCDSDSDGYGNVCDPDFDQSFAVNAIDFSMFFISAFKGLDPAPWPQGLDLDCNGSVGAADFSMMFVPKFKGVAPGGAKPGPSGLSCAGTAPCPAP